MKFKKKKSSHKHKDIVNEGIILKLQWTSFNFCGVGQIDRNPLSLSPSDLFFQFGAEQQISEEEDVSQLPRSFHQLHHEAVPQQLPVL